MTFRLVCEPPSGFGSKLTLAGIQIKSAITLLLQVAPRIVVRADIDGCCTTSATAKTRVGHKRGVTSVLLHESKSLFVRARRMMMIRNRNRKW